MYICGGNFSFFFASGQSYESCLNSNNINFPISKPNFPSVNLNTCYNNPPIFFITTTSYLDCLQTFKPNDEDLNLIDADKCALKLDANATQKNLKTEVNTKAWRLPKSRSSHTFIIFAPIHFTLLTWPKCTWFDNLWLCLDKVPFTQSLSSLQDKLIDKKWHKVVSLL